MLKDIFYRSLELTTASLFLSVFALVLFTAIDPATAIESTQNAFIGLMFCSWVINPLIMMVDRYMYRIR